MITWESAQRMVDRIVESIHPQLVIVFGSLARGDCGPASDIDLLVVTPFTGSRRNEVLRILTLLARFDEPKDVIVLTPEEFEQTRDLVGTVAYPAVREGRVLHAT